MATYKQFEYPDDYTPNCLDCEARQHCAHGYTIAQELNRAVVNKLMESRNSELPPIEDFIDGWIKSSGMEMLRYLAVNERIRIQNTLFIVAYLSNMYPEEVMKMAARGELWG